MSHIEGALARRAFCKISGAMTTAGVLAPGLMPNLFAGAAPNRPLRVGLISAASYGRPGAPRTQGSNHGTAFASACNGYDPSKRRAFAGTFVAAGKRIEGVQVVRIWDPIRSAAENLASVCAIPTICDRADVCADDVDAVLLLDDG